MPKDFTAAQNYRDIDGNMRTFTVIDHDVKSSISASSPMDKTELEELQESIKDYEERVIEEILLFPAVSVAGMGLFDDLILRDKEDGVHWDKKLVKESCRINGNLRQSLRLFLWRRTVKEQYWHLDMSHEDILKEEWKKLMY